MFAAYPGVSVCSCAATYFELRGIIGSIPKERGGVRERLSLKF